MWTTALLLLAAITAATALARIATLSDDDRPLRATITVLLLAGSLYGAIEFGWVDAALLPTGIALCIQELASWASFAAIGAIGIRLADKPRLWCPWRYATTAQAALIVAHNRLGDESVHPGRWFAATDAISVVAHIVSMSVAACASAALVAGGVLRWRQRTDLAAAISDAAVTGLGLVGLIWSGTIVAGLAWSPAAVARHEPRFERVLIVAAYLLLIVAGLVAPIGKWRATRARSD